MSAQLLTISQLAKYVGVTVRAVRHYHALGLLTEPGRDSSGYRRYDADAVVKLTRIKTLAEAGVPLSQIEALAEAPKETFTAAIASIKSDITKRIGRLKKTKQRLDTLRSGDRMFVSEVITDYLGYLQHIGLSEATITYERNAWILISALYPTHADAWAIEKKAIIAQPDVAALYRRLDKAQRWPADDPRIRELAVDIICMARQPDATPIAAPDELTANKQAYSLISQHSVDTFPSLRRLQDIIKELIDKA